MMLSSTCHNYAVSGRNRHLKNQRLLLEGSALYTDRIDSGGAPFSDRHRSYSTVHAVSISRRYRLR